MAYNTKSIITDKDGNPISQYYNKELDRFEPVEGSFGANKVVLYNLDGSINNSLSLLPMLDKLSQLTGTVIDEETRKSNELQRIVFYNQLQQMLADGELKGEQGIQGIQGETGKGLEFNWRGTELGVKIEGDLDYIYVNLKGETGSIDNLNSQHIEDALRYVPANVVDLDSHKDNFINPHNVTLEQINAMNAMGGYVPEDDYNKAVKPGWYLGTQSSKNAPPYPGMYGVLLVQVRGNNIHHLSLYGDEVSARIYEGNTGEWSKWGTLLTNKPIPWINATLQNGWTGELWYRKNAIGQLEIKLKINSGVTTLNTPIANLPSGYRPSQPAIIQLYSITAGRGEGQLAIGEGSGNIFITGTTNISPGTYSGVLCTI